MEIINVILENKTIDVNQPFRLTFQTTKAESPWFEFPFMNDSLDKKLIQFSKEDANNAI